MYKCDCVPILATHRRHHSLWQRSPPQVLDAVQAERRSAARMYVHYIMAIGWPVQLRFCCVQMSLAFWHLRCSSVQAGCTGVHRLPNRGRTFLCRCRCSFLSKFSRAYSMRSHNGGVPIWFHHGHLYVSEPLASAALLAIPSGEQVVSERKDLVWVAGCRAFVCFWLVHIVSDSQTLQRPCTHAGCLQGVIDKRATALMA